MDVSKIPEPERAIWQTFHRPVDEGGVSMKVDPDEALRRFIEARDRAESIARDNEFNGMTGGESISEQDALAEAVVAASDLIEWLARGGWPPDWPSHMNLAR